MGYGEFGGTGSVKWQVLYDDPHDATAPTKNPTGRKRRGHGRDDGPETEKGKILYVRCTNARLVGMTGNTFELEVTLAKNDEQVVLRWGNDPPLAWPTTEPVSVQPMEPGAGTGGPTTP
jgi:hypothetical protein